MRAKVFIIALLTVISLTGCRYWGVRGNGDIAKEDRSIGEFTELEVSGAFVVYVQLDEEPYLEIETDENLMSYIEIYSRGDKLIIESDKNLNPTEDVVIHVSTYTLERLESAGANSVIVKEVDTDELRVEISGAGSAKFRGIVNRLKCDLAGAVHLYADELEAEDVDIDVSGACNANVFATNRLKADVSGASSLYYKGNPEQKLDVSGVSKIERIDKESDWD